MSCGLFRYGYAYGLCCMVVVDGADVMATGCSWTATMVDCGKG